MPPPLLQTQNLTRTFGNVTALADFNLEVAPGEWVILMGPSGSGKTTLMNLIALLDTPSSGSIFLQGKDVARLDEQARTVLRRESIGMIFQQFHLIPHLTALENVMLAQYFHSLTDADEAAAALKRVRLDHRLDHLPRQLSGGEKQRVCIARALINDPALILADEPTGNLDEENENTVLNILQELHTQGKTIILITHNPALGRFANNIVKLDHGRRVSI